jgi:hypothetical protein
MTEATTTPYTISNVMGWNLDARTLQKIHFECLSVTLVDLSENEEARDEPVTMLLHEFFEVNEDNFTPYQTLQILADLLRLGRATIEPAMGQKYELQLEGICDHQSDEWNFETVTLAQEVMA